MAEVADTTPEGVDIVPRRKRFWTNPQGSIQLSSVLAILTGLFLWEVFGRVSDALFFPPFTEVIFALQDLLISGELVRAFTVSLAALVAGFGLAVVLGLTIGTLMGLSPRLESLLGFYVNIFMAAPLIALIPIIIIFLGLDLNARASVVFLFSFFVITVNAEAGMKATRPEHLEMARAFSLSRWRTFVVVRLPAATPAYMAGLRLGIIRAVKGMVTAELFMSLTGLGALVDYYGSQFQADKLFAVLMAIIAVALVAGALVNRLDRRLTHWQHSMARE